MYIAKIILSSYIVIWDFTSCALKTSVGEKDVNRLLERSLEGTEQQEQ